MNRFIAAVVQMDSQDSVGKNLDTAAALVEEAARRGARLVALPESMHYLGRDPAGHAEEIPGGPTFRRMSQLAREHGLWLHCGSIYERTPEDPPALQHHHGDQSPGGAGGPVPEAPSL